MRTRGDDSYYTDTKVLCSSTRRHWIEMTVPISHRPARAQPKR